MKEYVCTICGYIHKGDMSDDFRCPVCGAGKEAFREVTKESVGKNVEKPADIPDTELSAMEMSIVCSNLARGCEKQYMPKEQEKFEELAAFFRRAAGNGADGKTGSDVEKLVGLDLEEKYPYAFSVAKQAGDRGALRSLVWSEKVTKMLQSLLARYEKEGDKMLENTGVYVCGVCGFVFVGDAPPALCPVCKVPSWKFEKVQGRVK